MSIKEVDYKQMDVFTSVPFKGNPLAVVFDADDLTNEQMQLIATWTNLSETIFIMNPTVAEADYKTPGAEVPFAGHPTIGACFAYRDRSKLITRKYFVQECEAGLVQLEVKVAKNNNTEVFFKLPKIRLPHTPEFSIEVLLKLLGLRSTDLQPGMEPKLIDVGPRWFVVQLNSCEEVLKLEPNMSELEKFSQGIGITGCCCFGEISNNLFETRTFAPVIGVNEDPVCGSGAGAIGVFLSAKIGSDKYFNLRQGCRVARDGRIQVCVEDEENIKVGGDAVTVIDGTIKI